jgi:hypothetical protein
MQNLLDMNREIFFNVYEENIMGTQTGTVADDKKMLLRDRDGNPNDTSYLSVVSDKYRVVTNEEILVPLQQQMINYFDPIVLEEVKIKDTLSSNGVLSYSEYRLPRVKRAIETDTGHRTEFGLTFVMKNTFDGKGSVTMWSGLIDFFCTNGTVTGEYDITRKRHSRNFNTDGFISAFEMSMERHKAAVEQYQRYADMKIASTVKVQNLFDKLTNTNRAEQKRSGGLSDRLFAQWVDEVKVRGSNVFSVQSALTHYASHDDDRFALTKAGDGATLYKRSEQVTKWLSSNVWNDFVENLAA